MICRVGSIWPFRPCTSKNRIQQDQCLGPFNAVHVPVSGKMTRCLVFSSGVCSIQGFLKSQCNVLPSCCCARSWDELHGQRDGPHYKAAWNCSARGMVLLSLYWWNSPLFLPHQAFLPFKGWSFIRTQLPDFRRSQCLQKLSMLDAEIIFTMSVLILWAELMLLWCRVLFKKVSKLQILFGTPSYWISCSSSAGAKWDYEEYHANNLNSLTIKQPRFSNFSESKIMLM